MDIIGTIKLDSVSISVLPNAEFSVRLCNLLASEVFITKKFEAITSNHSAFVIYEANTSRTYTALVTRVNEYTVSGVNIITALSFNFRIMHDMARRDQCIEINPVIKEIRCYRTAMLIEFSAGFPTVGDDEADLVFLDYFERYHQVEYGGKLYEAMEWYRVIDEERNSGLL